VRGRGILVVWMGGGGYKPQDLQGIEDDGEDGIQ